jgi:hypothetical protein
MDSGTLGLKAWGFGAFPQAQLHFDNQLLLRNQYWPIWGLISNGTAASAHRCKTCKLVCFDYPSDPKQAQFATPDLTRALTPLLTCLLTFF